MNELGRLIGSGAVRFERDLPGPIERAWSYLTEAGRLPEWFAEGAVANRVGGPVTFDFGVTGEVTEFNPPHVLEYTWNEETAPNGPIRGARICFELSENGNRVCLNLTHSSVPENALVSLGAGWHTYCERLRCILADREPVPVHPLYDSLQPIYAEHFQETKELS